MLRQRPPAIVGRSVSLLDEPAMLAVVNADVLTISR
jgi:hypothetical protein